MQQKIYKKKMQNRSLPEGLFASKHIFRYYYRNNRKYVCKC